jgi:hypothetical protein
MADETPGTDINGAPGTGGTPPTATPPEQTPNSGKPAGTPTDQNGDTVVIPKKDYNNLIAQRDRANNANGQPDEAFQQMQYDFYKTKAVDQAVKDYPDVPRDVFEASESPEQMETLAKAFQRHAEKVKQDALKDLTNVDTGTLTSEQKAERLDKLKDSGNLAGAIGLKLFGK